MFSKKIALVMIAVLAICTGCASQKTDVGAPYGQMLVRDGLVGNATSSYVQWNKEYAVTVKHSDVKHQVAYNSEDYDVRFVKKRSNTVPVWTDAQKGEILSMTGYPRPYQKEPTIRQGADVGTVNVYDKTTYRGVKTLIIRGMSGGPVLNANKEVVGINVAYSTVKVVIDGEQSDVSVYLPRDVIQAEWDKFKAQNPDKS